MLFPPEHFEWPAPWQPFVEDASWLEWANLMVDFGKSKENAKIPATVPAELQRECCAEHPLYGRVCVPIAQSLAYPDDFLFITDNPEMPIAFVHLTWSRESNAMFPYTVGYASWEEFRVAWSRD
jgi:hypothetical protein